MRLFWTRFEFLFTTLGVVLVIALTVLFTPSGVSHWKFAVIMAIIVGLGHATTFWALHRRQRAARLKTITEMQMMLNDIINNQLTVIQTAAGLNDSTSEQAKAAVAAIHSSVTTITKALQHISDDSLREWHFKYAHRTRRSTD